MENEAAQWRQGIPIVKANEEGKLVVRNKGIPVTQAPHEAITDIVDAQGNVQKW